jgi:nicotinate-nucleotide adenylyltransferase
MYGGSFDPVHHGHLALARAAIEQYQLSPLYVVPAFSPPHKETTQASFAHRLAMARLAFADWPHLVISDLEKRRGGVSYTIDSVTHLQKQHPTSELCLLIGADTFAEIDLWKAPRRLARIVRLLVAPRAGHRLHSSGEWRVEEVTMELVEISATEIRQAVQENKPIFPYVPEAVAAYIARHGLYRS